MFVSNNISFKAISKNQKDNFTKIKPLSINSLAENNQLYPTSELSKVYFTGNVWKKANDEKRNNIKTFANEYMEFLNVSKTDLAAVREVVKRAEKEGFKPWPMDKPEELLKPGEKFYRVTDDRAVSLIVTGKDNIEKGFKWVGSHCDSPGFTLKANPFQKAAGGFEIAKVIPHGSLKNHQWTQMDLALMGEVILKDGSKVIIDIGNNPNDPVIVIPELAPHVDRNHRSQNPGDAFPNENMTPIVALSNEDETNIAKTTLDLLKKKYGIDKDDLINADLVLVPAEKARKCGIDESMISAYGQDDKSSIYCSMKAIFEAANKSGSEGPQKTMICSVFSNEEIGSENTYGAASHDLRDMITELVEYTTGSTNPNKVSKALRNTVAVSADVSHAIMPTKPEAEEATNSAKLGYGFSVKRNGKLFATPEALHTFLKTQEGLERQIYTYNQDKGGGGTIGKFMSTNLNMPTVDTGVPLIGMHAPYEITSIADIYEYNLSMLNYYTK